VGLPADLEDVKRKFLILPGLELQSLGRPARSQSLYRLRYPGFSAFCRISECSFSGGAEENKIKPQVSQVQPEFELTMSQIRVESVAATSVRSVGPFQNL
jgi:hypothetical protein